MEGQRDEGCHMEPSQNTILYVSFVPDVAKKRQKALESAGMHVVLVAEPEAVLLACKQHRPPSAATEKIARDTQ